MKVLARIALCLALSFVLSGNTFAETKIVDTFKYKVEDDEVRYTIYTLCIDGYKFITTQDIDFESRGAGNTRSVSTSTSVNTIQFMIAENGKMIPAKCD
jgi:hypothetical protein